MDAQLERIYTEASRLGKDASLATVAHSVCAAFWSRFHLLIGIPTAVLSAAAGIVAYNNQIPNNVTITAVLAILVACLVTISTTVDAKEKAAKYEQAATEYEVIREDASILNVQILDPTATAQDLFAELKNLNQRNQELLRNSPHISSAAKRRAVRLSKGKGSYFDLGGESMAGGVEVVQLKNVKDVYNYVTSQILAARESVDDVTWGSRTEYRTNEESEAYLRYVASIAQVCERGKVKYREVSSFANKHYVKRALSLVDGGYYSYHLGYYSTDDYRIPLMSFVIVDNKQVILGFYRTPVFSPENEVYISVTNPLMVMFFCDYYETLWAGSMKIKEGATVNENLLQKHRALLNHQMKTP